MKLRLRWLPLVPGVLLAACAPSVTGPLGTPDVGVDVSTYVLVDVIRYTGD